MPAHDPTMPKKGTAADLEANKRLLDAHMKVRQSNRLQPPPEPIPFRKEDGTVWLDMGGGLVRKA